jgi:hypothetical protein
MIDGRDVFLPEAEQPEELDGSRGVGHRNGHMIRIAKHEPTLDREITALDRFSTMESSGLEKSGSQKNGSQKGKSPSQLIDGRIKELGDWRGETLSRIRALIKEADPEVVEEWKWRGVPCWYHDGLICTGETYKNVVKMTFAKGASLNDASGLFNSSLEGNTRRAIDIREGEKINAKALKALVRAAVALNESKARK